MMIIVNSLPYIQIILSIILIVAILLQQSNSDSGSVFGGGDGSSVYKTRRGFEKFLFATTIVTSILFVVFAFMAILFK